MAHSLRRPICTALRFNAPAPRRCFSHFPPLMAAQHGPKMGGMIKQGGQQAEKSLRVLQKHQSVQAYPTDMGLLPETFVPTTISKMPSVFKTPKLFLKLQYKRFRFRLRDFASILVLKIISPKGKRWYNRRMKIGRMTIAPTATALHRQMYTAFAEGDVNALKKICTDGIFESFRSRIANRAKGEKVTWELLKYNKGARLVSHRGTSLPVDGMALRQAVVKISSTQKLTRWTKGRGGVMEMVPGSGKVKDVVEYVVVQRRTVNNEEEAWMIWGTTGETGLEEVEEWERSTV